MNDFGALNIDSELVVGVESNVISLANGCVCCQVRDDLVEAAQEIVSRDDGVDYIILEASGVADPSSLFTTFHHPDLRDDFRLDSISCVVDADQVLQEDEHPQLRELKLRQIAFSDLVIVNKVDLAGRDKVKEVRDWIDNRMNRVRIVETEYGNVPLEILLSVGRFDPAFSAGGLSVHHEHDHGETFETASFETTLAIDLKRLEATARKLPGGIYRCKGIVYCSDDPSRRAVLQVVGRRVDVSILDGWGDQERSTRIVAIGSPGSVSPEILQDNFSKCLDSVH